MYWDLSHYGLRHIIKDEAAKTSPYAVWCRQGAQVASQRSLILLGDSGIIQHICRWHKALNPKYLEFKHSNINQLYWVRVLFSFGYADYKPKSPGQQS